MPESYPLVHAGQRATAKLMNSFHPVTVRKTGDTSRTSLTPAADPDLRFSVVANAVYELQGALFVSSNEPSAGADPDDNIKIDWSAPTGSEGSWGASGRAEGGESDTGDMKYLGTATITNSRMYGTGRGGSTAPFVIIIQAVLITGSVDGIYSLDWSVGQNVNTAATITVYEHSHLVLTRVA